MKPRTVTRVVEEAAPPKIQPIAVGPEDAAEALHIGLCTMRRLLLNGDVRGIRVGRNWSIPVAELHRFCESFAGKEIEAA